MTESKQGVVHEPTQKTRSEVAALRSYGIPQEEVAAYISGNGDQLERCGATPTHTLQSSMGRS